MYSCSVLLLFMIVLVILETLSNLNFIPKLCLFITSLKRTTDVMFGGKQVLVCGYGEVSTVLLGSMVRVKGLQMTKSRPKTSDMWESN